MLRAGLPVRDKTIERNDGRKFVTTLQVNVEQRGGVRAGTGSVVSYRTDTGNQRRHIENQAGRGKCHRPRRSNAATRGRTGRRIRPISKWMA